MSEQLREYYEQELDFLRNLGAEFAARHPDVAARLRLNDYESPDPHVERLIEACAFLTGRIRLKLDDEFPQLTEALLNVLYPHYLAPLPAMGVVQFSLPPAQSNPAAGQTLARDTMLQSPPVRGTRCRFRTCYPVTLWPLKVTAASLGAPNPPDNQGVWERATLRIGLSCTSPTPLAQLRDGGTGAPLDRLRFFINGDAPLAYALYQLIFNHATQIELRAVGDERSTPIAPIPLHIEPVGFHEDEGMLPYTKRSFSGYRLLTEFFACPEKFLFFDVTGLAQATGFGQQCEIVIHLQQVAPPNAQVKAETFQLGCAPAVNLFEQTAEPIPLTQEKTEYRVIPDIGRQEMLEVYAVNGVAATGNEATQVREFQPFYSLRHSFGGRRDEAFWYAVRRPLPEKRAAQANGYRPDWDNAAAGAAGRAPRDDEAGTDVYLCFVDRNFKPEQTTKQRVTVQTTCTNRNLPRELFGAPLDIIGAQALWRAQFVREPRPAGWAAERRGAQWRLISHLALNHLSLTDDAHGGGGEALRRILLLYAFGGAAFTDRQLERGIIGVSSRSDVRPLPIVRAGVRVGAGFVRGVATTLVCDESEFPRGGVFLFSAVLERFLGLYVSLNSFHRLIVKTKQRGAEPLKEWPPRTGEQIIL